MEENQVNYLWLKVSNLNIANTLAQVNLAFSGVRGEVRGEERSWGITMAERLLPHAAGAILNLETLVLKPTKLEGQHPTKQ